MDDVLKRALLRWGLAAQRKQAIEECSELITAILHFERGKCSDVDVVTEIADVLIMCEQLKIMFGKKRVDTEVKRKLNRLKKRIEL